MSTRANVILEKDGEKLYLYRHCDGYPSGLGIELEECLHTEYPVFSILKIGGIELTNNIHGDIDYLYTIDLNNKQLITKKV